MEQNIMGELLASKERDYERLREQYEKLEFKLENNNKDQKQLIADLKKEIAVRTSK